MTNKQHKPYTSRADKSLRTRHCSRLARILHQCRQRKQAAGVLSVLLKGTSKERLPDDNRFKYLAAMHLLKGMDARVNPFNIRQLHEIWSQKNGSKRKSYVKDNFSVYLELIIYYFTHGKVDEAYVGIMSLLSEGKYENDPVLNMVAGLVFYEIWYAGVPEEMKMQSSDMHDPKMLIEISGLGSCLSVETTCPDSAHLSEIGYVSDTLSSACPESVHLSEVGYVSDTLSSIGNNENEYMDSGHDLPGASSGCASQHQHFYIEDSSEMSGDTDHQGDNLLCTSIFKSCGLDASLFPIRLPEHKDSENSFHMHINKNTDYYNKAVKHLQFALHSCPPVLASLLPLVQLLLLGGQVDKAVGELEHICKTSCALLPLRIKSILLECFSSNDSAMLSTCYEDILKKDPRCNQSLTKLISMHEKGEYNLVPLMEMIASHLDATYASSYVWEKLASCFAELCHYEDDRNSGCGNTNGGLNRRCQSSPSGIHILRVLGNLVESWELRCRWWSSRHFSENLHVSEREAGKWELLACKAACASHIYGPECEYVASAKSCIGKEEKRQQFIFLKLHMKKSIKLWELIKQQAKCGVGCGRVLYAQGTVTSIQLLWDWCLADILD